MRRFAFLPLLLLLAGCLMPNADPLVSGTVLKKQVLISRNTSGAGDMGCGASLPGDETPCEMIQSDEVTSYKTTQYVLVVQGVTKHGKPATEGVKVPKATFKAAKAGDRYACTGHTCGVTKP